MKITISYILNLFNRYDIKYYPKYKLIEINKPMYVKDLYYLRILLKTVDKNIKIKMEK